MQNNYETYSAEQFLDDAFFIEWIKYKTPRSEQFWAGWIGKSPANITAMREAEGQLRAILSVQRIRPGGSEAMDVWEQIQRSLRQEPDQVPGARGVRPLYRWMAAAAVLLFMALGLWFVVGRDIREKSTAVGPAIGQDFAPGGDKAVLTLADGSRVVLDTADNGALTRQGSVTVIKLNGQLAYNREGNTSAEVFYNTITTPKGGQYQLVLADGSKVWLNAASSLRFPTAFAGKERTVELRGEGYFEVAHDASKPFRVKVNDMEVQVLGTHFNINSYSDEPTVKTTLLEGRVMVKKADKKVYLNPGQQAQSAVASATVRVVPDVNTEEVIAWKNGYFSFHNADIQTVMRQLARWYGVEVVYKGAVPQRMFEGEMQRGLMLSQALKILQKNNVHFKIEGEKIVVMP